MHKIAFSSKQVNNFSLLSAIYCGIITSGRQINTANLQRKNDERDSKLKMNAIESRGMVKIGASNFSLNITLELQAEIIFIFKTKLCRFSPLMGLHMLVCEIGGIVKVKLGIV